MSFSSAYTGEPENRKICPKRCSRAFFIFLCQFTGPVRFYRSCRSFVSPRKSLLIFNLKLFFRMKVLIILVFIAFIIFLLFYGGEKLNHNIGWITNSLSLSAYCFVGFHSFHFSLLLVFQVVFTFKSTNESF